MVFLNVLQETGWRSLLLAGSAFFEGSLWVVQRGSSRKTNIHFAGPEWLDFLLRVLPGSSLQRLVVLLVLTSGCKALAGKILTWTLKLPFMGYTPKLVIGDFPFQGQVEDPGSCYT